MSIVTHHVEIRTICCIVDTWISTNLLRHVFPLGLRKKEFGEGRVITWNWYTGGSIPSMLKVTIKTNNDIRFIGWGGCDRRPKTAWAIFTEKFKIRKLHELMLFMSDQCNDRSIGIIGRTERSPPVTWLAGTSNCKVMSFISGFYDMLSLTCLLFDVNMSGLLASR